MATKQIQKDFSIELVDLQTGEIIIDDVVKDVSTSHGFKKIRQVFDRFMMYVSVGRNMSINVVSSDMVVYTESDLFNQIWQPADNLPFPSEYVHE